MSTENEQLVYELQARIDNFEQNFKQATQTANDNFSAMEARGRDAGNRMSESVKTATVSIADAFDSLQAPAKKTGDMIGALIGGGVIAGVVGLATTMNTLIDTLAKAGDRADDLRLPVNIIQALSVAADEARVPTQTLNSALDEFTKVSKQSASEAKDFYTALGNIGPSFVKAFQSAPSQVERLRVLMDAFKSTTDEVKRAGLAQEAFASDNERLISIMTGGRDSIADYIEEVRKLGLEIDESAVKKAQEAKSALNLLARVMTDELSSALAELIPSFKEFLPVLEAVAGHVRDTLAGFASPENRPLATLKNDATAAEEKIAALDAQLKQLDSFKPSTGVLGKVGGLLGADVSIGTNKNGDVTGVGVGVEATRKSIQDKIAATQAELDKYKQLIADRQKAEDVNKGKDGAEAPAFKPRPKLNDDSGTTSAFDRQTNALNRHIAALKADSVAIGLTNAAHQGLRAELALLQAAQRDGDGVTNEQIDKYTQLRASMSSQQALAASGIKLNKDNAASFTEVTSRMVDAAQKLDDYKQHFQGVNDALRFSGNQLVDVLDRATQKGANFGQIMQDVLRTVERQLLQAAVTGDGAFGKLFGTASTTGGVGGIFGGLAKLFGGARAGGGDVDTGKAYIVGEKRPEIFVPRTAGTIIPRVPTSGGTSQTNVINNHITVNGAGGQQHTNQDLAERIGKEVHASARSLIATELRTQMKPGGLLHASTPTR